MVIIKKDMKGENKELVNKLGCIQCSKINDVNFIIKILFYDQLYDGSAQFFHEPIMLFERTWQP